MEILDKEESCVEIRDFVTFLREHHLDHLIEKIKINPLSSDYYGGSHRPRTDHKYHLEESSISPDQVPKLKAKNRVLNFQITCSRDLAQKRRWELDLLTNSWGATKQLPCYTWRSVCQKTHTLDGYRVIPSQKDALEKAFREACVRSPDLTLLQFLCPRGDTGTPDLVRDHDTLWIERVSLNPQDPEVCTHAQPVPWLFLVENEEWVETGVMEITFSFILTSLALRHNLTVLLIFLRGVLEEKYQKES